MKKISHDEFVAALAKELKADAVIIDSRLNEFMEALVTSVQEKGAVTIDNLGEITLSEGKLLFKPDETLALEVNFKYAGMEAIEIMPAYAKKLKEDDQDDADGTEKQPLTPLETSKEEEKHTETDSNKAETPKSSQKQEADPKSKESEEIDDDDPFNLSGPEANATMGEEGYSGEKKESTDESNAIKDASAEGKQEKTNEDKPVETPGAAKKGEEPDTTDDKPRSNTAFYAVAAIAAILIAGLYIYQADNLPFNFPGKSSTEVITMGEPEESEPASFVNHELRQAELPDEDETSSGESEASEAAETPAATVSSTVTAEVEDSEYGIYGDLTEVDRSFTIVVHSLPYRLASNERDKIDNLGYRSTLYSVTKDNGDETWRVGIGQFETMDDAAEAIQSLDEPYKDENFVARIR
ncbi:MAG: hypothetical protein WD491_05060 [Balneolales bacterium]